MMFDVKHQNKKPLVSIIESWMYARSDINVSKDRIYIQELTKNIVSLMYEY